MSEVFDCTPVLHQIEGEIEKIIEALEEYREAVFKRPIQILVNKDDKASVMYANMKKKAFEKWGFKDIRILDSIKDADPHHPFMAQMPMKDYNQLLFGVPLNAYRKDFGKLADMDIDALGYNNTFRLFTGAPYLLPATVEAIVRVIKHKYGDDLRGLRVCIVGKSTIIGKPLALYLMNEGVTVTIFGKDERLPETQLQGQDVVVLATNKTHLFTSDDIPKEVELVVDAGIGFTEEGKTVGNLSVIDVVGNFEYTPVPKGIGPLTVACLVLNTLKGLI